MKRIITIAVAVAGLCLASAASAQTAASFLVPNPETAKWSYIQTDADGNYLSTQYHSVEKLTGNSTNGNMKVNVEEVSATSPADTVKSFIFYRFKDGEFMVDMNAFFEDDFMADILEEAEEKSSELTEEDMEKAMDMIRSEFQVSGEIKGIPRYPEVGKLPKYEFHFKVSFFSIKVICDNRMIVGKEKLVTDAGTFDCFILEETMTTKVMLAKEVEKVKTWYAYGIGMVKEVTYDKKGNVVSTLTLNSINW